MSDDKVLERLDALTKQLREALRPELHSPVTHGPRKKPQPPAKTLAELEQRMDDMDSTTQTALDHLNAEVSRQGTLIAANKALLEGLNAQIEALKNKPVDPAIPAGIDQSTAAVKANNDKQAADIVANNPA